MLRNSSTLLVCLILACSGGSPGPFGDIAASKKIKVPGLSATVDLVRDQQGVPHIYAETLGDAAYANGYVLAHDRIVQMNLFRNFASGTLGNLFGALDPNTLSTDLSLRMHGFRRYADAAWVELSASTDATDQEIVVLLTRYADGVNAFVDELKSGQETLGANVTDWFKPDTFEPWTPVDSLAIGRLQQWALSYGSRELDITSARQLSEAAFNSGAIDPELAKRTGAFFDLFLLRAMDTTSTIDGFPNVGTDTGSRATRRGFSQGVLPVVPTDLLKSGQKALGHTSAFGVELKSALYGSNNWVLGNALTGDKPMIANDPHLQLSSPSIWHLIHISVPGTLTVEGVSFPGIPGILLGHNEHIAWGATVVSHDVTDFYLETIVPCSAGPGDCVMFEGNEVAIELREETFNLGALGTLLESFTATYEVVPHHGPILPIIENDRIVPRTSNQAISVKYTGYQVTHDFRAFYGIQKAQTRGEAFAAIENYTHGAQNFVIADDTGDFGWTSYALVPLRSPGCTTYDRETNPTGLAPFFVLPGDGSCEWEGWLDARYVPHSVNPAQGYLATANQDPVGETADGNALNGPMVDGRPLYAGWAYDSGFRVGRITRRLEEMITAGADMTMDDMASIQGDTFSNVGNVMRPHFASAYAAMLEELATPNTHADLAVLAAGLTTAQEQSLADAAARIAAWSLETPAAVEGTFTPTDAIDSGATTIFNIAMVYFLRDSFLDELSLMGESVGSQTTARTGLAVFENPGSFVTGLAIETGEPLLCDNLNTLPVESCRRNLMRALVQTMQWGQANFGNSDPDTWAWGTLHRTTFSSQLPDPSLDIPSNSDPMFSNGYPRHGDEHAVDVGNGGYGDFGFTYGAGASMRHITQFVAPGTPVTWMALPGGQIHDPESPHFRDLADNYWRVNEYFVMPWTVDDVIAQAEDRWQFRP